MKLGWVTKPIGDVCSVVNGGTPKSAITSYWGGDVNWLTPKDMGKMAVRNIFETPRKISDEGLGNCSAKLVPPHSVIMSTRAPIGHLAINDVPMAFNQGCRGMVPDDGLDPIYLFHFLSANAAELNNLGTGATFKELSSSALKAFPLPLPPLEEQQRIVAVLDEAFEGLARARVHAEANLQNARELFDTTVSQCFIRASETATTKTTLGTIAAFRNGLNYTRASKGKSVKIVGVGDFKDHFTVPVETLSEINVDGDLADDDRLRPGDLLAVRSNGNKELIGRTMMVPDLSEVLSFSGFTIRIRLLTDSMLPEYLCEFMRTNAARRIMIDGGGGANISNLNQKLLSGLSISFPSIEQQWSVLEELERVRANAAQLVATYETKLQDLADLRQSLLQKAFAGELT